MASAQRSFICPDLRAKAQVLFGTLRWTGDGTIFKNNLDDVLGCARSSNHLNRPRRPPDALERAHQDAAYT